MSFRNLMHVIWLSVLLAMNVCHASTLEKQYAKHCHQVSDIHEHLPVLRQLSQDCDSVIEIGVRSMVSTWGILRGLADSPYHPKFYLGIDLNDPPEKHVRLARALAEQNGISFKFWKGNDLDAEVESVDMCPSHYFT